ncbi:MAG: hypothetical protein A2Z99_04795 [Treponema sp. GWB1_62_6]|nr:MAG: hypothetical protein A2Y36_10770 [Treponema sp. GWA1_62_8]OHE63942.1 MAG: hypothetical protein A2001_01925 [Treponema sp. GWC1_61_84]OHE67235.1 MAG: hypothetical protein A2Z99_04795 [Treponema sp. GWB1_62_6]OHE76702.1 MAG: hypothetical protein A2413_20235 [Treponema sp. RIFOXYC1_FULL_61_9]HCM25265.1 hypothetical protein [Treponema sp.]
MSLYCFLLAPLVAWFRRPALRGGGAGRGIFIAFASGAIAAAIGSAIGPLLPSGLFDFIRWVRLLAAVAFPPLIPLVLLLAMEKLSLARIRIDAETFALVFLVPFGAARALSVGESYDPLTFVLIPSLWCALAVGVPAMVRLARDEIGLRSYASGACAALLPLAAATSAWAFFSNLPLIGSVALAASAAPASIALARIHLAAIAPVNEPGESVNP